MVVHAVFLDSLSYEAIDDNGVAVAAKQTTQIIPNDLVRRPRGWFLGHRVFRSLSDSVRLCPSTRPGLPAVVVGEGGQLCALSARFKEYGCTKGLRVTCA